MIMRELQRVDFKIYLQALKVYFRNPVIALAPLAAGLTNVLLSNAGSVGGITWLIALLLDLFALAVAVIAADYAWRYNRVRLDQAWNDAWRKISDILMASLGIVFVMFLPSLFGDFFGPLVPFLQAIAFTFLIYTIPAAAIGGTPGQAALQASVDRTRANPATTAILFLVCYGAYTYAPLIDKAVLSALGDRIWGDYFTLVAMIVSAFTRAFSFGYIALVISKIYSNASYGRRVF